MSVINRMLADLEEREAPAARGPDALAAPGSRPRRRLRAALRRLLPAVLALALVAVAALLWLQRGPELVAWVLPAAQEGAADGAAASPEGAGGDGDAGGDAAADPGATALPALVGLEFTAADEGARLALVFDGEPEGRPRYVRSGSQLSLRVAARPDDAVVPAPPGGQGVFRALSVERAAGDGAVIRLDVAEDARIEVRDEGARLVLVGTRPATAEPAAPRGSVAGAVADAGAAPVGAARPGEAAAGARAGADDAADVPDAPAADEGAPARAGDAEVAAQPDAPPDAGAGAQSDAPADARAEAQAEAPARADGGAQAAEDAGTGDAAAPDGAAAGDTHADAVRKVERSSSTVRAQRRYRTAREALAAGNIAVARGRLRAALEADPDLHGARELLAALLRRAGDAPAARDVLADGLERSPTRPGFAKPHARLLVDSGELERAARVLERAARAAAGDPGYHALVAAIAQRLGRHEQAAMAYTRALEIDAGQGRWWLGLGISLAASGHPGEARAAFREARSTGDLTARLDSWARGRIEALGDDGD